MTTEIQQQSSRDLESMYNNVSRDFRKIWSQYSKNRTELLSTLETMIDILIRENPNTSIHKVLNKIADDHSDLEKQGFSKSNLYKYVQISKYGCKLQKNRFSHEKSKLPITFVEQSSTRASQEREEVEAEAKQLAKLHGIDLEEESPMVMKGFTSLSGKIERLSKDLNKAITQRDHYKKDANDEKVKIILLLRSQCERLEQISKGTQEAYLVVDFDTHDEFPYIASISDQCPTSAEVMKIIGGG